jgi:hypothetical protein
MENKIQETPALCSDIREKAFLEGQFLMCICCKQKNCRTGISVGLRSFGIRRFPLGYIKKAYLDTLSPKEIYDYADFQMWWCSIKCWNAFVEQYAALITVVLASDVQNYYD